MHHSPVRVFVFRAVWSCSVFAGRIGLARQRQSISRCRTDAPRGVGASGASDRYCTSSTRRGGGRGILFGTRTLITSRNSSSGGYLQFRMQFEATRQSPSFPLSCPFNCFYYVPAQSERMASLYWGVAWFLRLFNDWELERHRRSSGFLRLYFLRKGKRRITSHTEGTYPIT